MFRCIVNYLIIVISVIVVFVIQHYTSSVRHSLSREALLTLIHALLVSKLDYCNSVLVGVTRTLQRRLQSVFNAAARLVFSARRSEHNATPP